MAEREPSDDWTTPQVLKRLREQAKSGEPVSMQVFLRDDVSADALGETAASLVGSVDAKLGKVHRLAKSFSVRGSPEALEQIARSSAVKSILPSEIEDIHPKPTNVKPS
jgi:hypothetical protein